MSRAFLFVMMGCAGCSSSEPVGPEGGADAATEAMTGGDAGDATVDSGPFDAGVDSGAPRFCTTETPVITGDGGVVATTTHYELYAETTSAEATNLARLLEASLLGFESWFEKSAPPPHLKVKYLKDEPSWEAAMIADSITPPVGAGGYYSPSNQTVYLYEQGNVYYTHTLIVHEALHQFHFITRLKAPSVPFWYVEGHAEYLSRHDWDGTCVSLGVTSLLSYEDLPAQSLAGSADFAAILNGTATGTRADAWAIFRNLDTGPLKSSFKAYRDAFDANLAPSFTSVVTPPATLATTLNAWIPTAQEPMRPSFAGWIHVGPHAARVESPVYLTIATVKQKTPTHFEGKFELPTSGNWTVGAIVSYTDDQNYIAVLHAKDTKVLTFTAIAGNNTWAQIGTAPLSGGTLDAFTVDQTGGTAKVAFNGTTLTVPVTAPRVGLAASDTTGNFIDVDWK